MVPISHPDGPGATPLGRGHHMRDTIVTIKAADGELYGGHLQATFDKGGTLHGVILHTTADGGEMALEGQMMHASDGAMVPIDHGNIAAAMAARSAQQRIAFWEHMDQKGREMEQAAEMAAEDAAADALYGFGL